MTFEDLLEISDPSTLEEMSEEALYKVLREALTNCPPIEERWINAKVQSKTKTPTKKSTTKKATQVKKKDEIRKKELIETILKGATPEMLKALGK